MKRSQRLQNQGKILDDIMSWKRQELKKQKVDTPESNLRALAAFTPPTLDFYQALKQPGVSLIAEVKKASPSKGLLCRDFDPVELALTYAKGQASAISCLTDSRFFQGKLVFLTQIKEAFQARKIQLPVLRKDFIFDPYQVLEARVAGADAVLLIMTVLSDSEYRDLITYAHELGMAVLVEVHEEVELQRALLQHPRIIGINNRDLKDFSVDLAITSRLKRLLPDEIVVVSESGIRGREEVEVLRSLQVDAMLVGESLVTLAPDRRRRKLQELVTAGRPH